jgi:hypothetical protein
MNGSVGQAQELKDLRAYAELAVYYLVTRGGRDVSPGELHGILQALRDILGDFTADAAADREVEAAFAEARERAARIGEDMAAWPESCPWRLPGLIDQLTSLIAELEVGLPDGPGGRREAWPGRSRAARGRFAPRRDRGGKRSMSR